MDRRLLIAALACWPAARLLAQEDNPRPHYRMSAAQLYEALSARFPVRFGLAGLLALQLSAPRLLLLPERNKLGATLLARASGPALQQIEPGEVDLVFSLRYEAGDQSLRAHQPEILDIRWPGLPPDTVQALRSLLPAVLREAVGEVVLHQFTARDLALADTMGFEPERVEVVADGLLVTFGPKRRR